MNQIFAKTFGGVSRGYYLRQLFFATLMAVLFLGIAWQQKSFLFMVVLSALLYPYSRFVYESVINFIVGDNFIIANVFLYFGVKLITMLLCFVLAIFIAPIGLIGLYIYHTKNKNADVNL